ncbi:restriction endonuclease subunit S [bacterium]|nr:restriction endonuclease subunit S [bacterium]
MRFPKGINPRFVGMQMQAPKFVASLNEVKSATTNVAALYQRDLKTRSVLVAPLPEQRRIVSAIESLQERSSRAKQALSEVGPLLSQLRQSVLRSAFNGDLTADWRAQNPHVEPASELLARIRTERRERWEAEQLAKYEEKGKKPPENWQDKYKEPEPADESELEELPEGWCWASIEDLLKDDGSLSYGVLKPGDPDPNGVPMLRVMDVGDWGLNGHTEIMKISPELAEQYKRTRLDAGDVILAVMATIGRTAVVPQQYHGANVNRALAVLKLTPLIASEFVVAAIRSPLFQDRFLLEKVGTAQARINLGDLRHFAFPLPPSDETAEILRLIKVGLDSTLTMTAKIDSSEAELTQLEIHPRKSLSRRVGSAGPVRRTCLRATETDPRKTRSGGSRKESGQSCLQNEIQTV